MKPKDKVVLSWVDNGQVDGAFAASMIELFSQRKGRIVAIQRGEGSGLLSRLRNQQAAGFLKMGGDWLLFIDSDETISVTAFDKLCDAADADTRPIVAGLVFAGWPGDPFPIPVPTIARFAEEGGLEPVWDYPRDKIIEVDSAGTGCLLVHRSVFEAMRATATEHEGSDWCFFHDGPIWGKYVSEDVSFIRKAASLGFPIHAHTGAVLGHRKRFWLDESVYRNSRIERAVVDPRTIERR